MIFDDAIPFEKLPESDSDLKSFLNYNPVQLAYTAKQNIPERNPKETDRAGWRGYDRVYTKYFKSLRQEKLHIMEIGIKEGYGIYAWQKYFKNSTLYGIDNDWTNSIIAARNNIKQKHPFFKTARLYNLDSRKEDNWLQFYGKKFDIIIDDGDHHPNSQVATFKFAWDYLKDGGLYFIEDVGHRYGEDAIKKLSDCISGRKSEFESLEIYSHNNAGLKTVMKNKNYLSINRSRIVRDENLNTTEYIIAIKKKIV